MDESFFQSRLHDNVYESTSNLIVFVNNSNLITQTSNIKLDLSYCLNFRQSGVSYNDVLSAISKTRSLFPCMLIYSCYRTRLYEHDVLYENGNGYYSTNMNCTLAELVSPNIQQAQTSNFFKFFYINFTPLGC